MYRNVVYMINTVESAYHTLCMYRIEMKQKVKSD